MIGWESPPAGEAPDYGEVLNRVDPDCHLRLMMARRNQHRGMTPERRHEIDLAAAGNEVHQFWAAVALLGTLLLVVLVLAGCDFPLPKPPIPGGGA